DRAVPAERRRRWRAGRPDAPRAARYPAAPRRRELPRAIIADRDPGRTDDDARSAGRPSPRGKPHSRRRGGARRACRLAGPGHDGGRRTEPGRTWSRPPTKCRGLTALATMTPPPSVHGDLAAPTVIAASIARERRRVLADLVALAKPRVVLMILVTTAVG